MIQCTYNGEIKHGKPHGYGKLTHQTGNGYDSFEAIGQFKDGSLNGTALMFVFDSGVTSISEYKDGRKTGYGRSYF